MPALLLACQSAVAELCCVALPDQGQTVGSTALPVKQNVKMSTGSPRAGAHAQ